MDWDGEWGTRVKSEDSGVPQLLAVVLTWVADANASQIKFVLDLSLGYRRRWCYRRGWSINISHDVHLLSLEDEYAWLGKLFYLALFIIYSSSLPLSFCGLLRRCLTCSTSQVGQVIASSFCIDWANRLWKTCDSSQSPAGAPCYQTIMLDLLAVCVPSDGCCVSCCESMLHECALCERTSLSDKLRSCSRTHGNSKTVLHTARWSWRSSWVRAKKPTFLEIKRGSVRPYEVILRRMKLGGTVDSANRR